MTEAAGPGSVSADAMSTTMSLLVKNLLFTVLVPGTVAVYVPILFTQGRRMTSGLGFVFAVGILAAGAAIYAWCIWDFARYGRGTPVPIDAPRRLVVRGLYRCVRNPMYLAVLSVIFGWAVLYGAVVLVGYALLVGTCFHLFVILYEEPHLSRTYGREYELYSARVGRWLPRFRRAD